MSDIDCVIDVHVARASSQPNERELRESFSSCGKILAIYPWRSSTGDKDHSFVKFSESESASEAFYRYRGHASYRVATLRTDAVLRERYRTVIDSCREKGELRTTSRFPDSLDSRDSPLPRHRHHRDDVSFRERRRSVSVPVREHLPSTDSIPEQVALIPQTSGNSDHPDIDFHSSDGLPYGSPIATREKHREDIRSQSSPEPVFRSERNPDDVLTMSIEGHPFSYVLDDLPDNPVSIILLLKKGDDNRGNWMMVGARYRRQKNLKAAEQVMQEFIRYMTDKGEGFDLKPAFLLLSTIYNDQAKATMAAAQEPPVLRELKKQNFVSSAAHYASIAVPLDPADLHLTQWLKSDSEKENINPLASREGIIAPQANIAPIRKLFNQPPLSCLLNLSSLRLAKRKLEFELMEERSVRRKVEVSLNDTRRLLEKAEQAACLAQAQLKQEIDRRRKSEDELQKASSAAKNKEQEMRHKACRATYLEIADTLTKAARGSPTLPYRH